MKDFNENLKNISRKLDIKKKVTSYVARHTFASVLAKGGENVLTISEMLGHSDLKTTQIYLKELNHTEKIEASKKLL
ncbi:MAG: tyrosine-type recombinase/integrase [Bacteroidales bacterium]|nr:tyrosine-type recombinase/integrase [Bacteroidales bacterium]